MEFLQGKSRCEQFGGYIAKYGATVRATAGYFGISKSTVHKDVTTELRLVNPALYEQVEQILKKNKEERHLRGGEATKQKYLRCKEHCKKDRNEEL